MHQRSGSNKSEKETEKQKYCPFDGYKYGDEEKFCFICKRSRNTKDNFVKIF